MPVVASSAIAVQHKSDMDKASKEAKRIRRAESQQRRIARFQRMICAHGFDGLSTADQNRARKHLSPAQIMQAQREYQQSLLPAPKDPQESFFTSEEDDA